jgi:hypothetical protein
LIIENELAEIGGIYRSYRTKNYENQRRSWLQTLWKGKAFRKRFINFYPGGFAKCYQGINLEDKKLVAIKVV